MKRLINFLESKSGAFLTFTERYGKYGPWLLFGIFVLALALAIQQGEAKRDAWRESARLRVDSTFQARVIQKLACPCDTSRR